MKYLFFVLFLLIFLTGCSSTNISELTKALANDPNTVGVFVNISTYMGPQQARICRSGPNVKVICNAEGMIVEPVK